MSNKVNGLWAVNSDGVFMFFNSVDSPSVWRFGMSDNVESWRMIPGVGNAQAVRGTDALCSLLLLTGARVGEALGLDVEDCRLNDGRPWVRFDRKGDWSQRVAIPSDASKALARLIGGRRRGAVFREDSGARLRQQTAVGIVSSVALRVGVPDISPHSLRRTFCTLSRDAGVPDRDHGRRRVEQSADARLLRYGAPWAGWQGWRWIAEILEQWMIWNPTVLFTEE